MSPAQLTGGSRSRRRKTARGGRGGGLALDGGENEVRPAICGDGGWNDC
jgi:hypothetical protein